MVMATDLQFFEAKHRSGSELDLTMVLFDEVVEVLGRSNFRVLR